LRECSIDLIYALLQVLPPPNRILHTECDFEELDPSQPEHGATVRSYVYQYLCHFWERASSSGFLPPVTLYLDRDLRFQRLIVKTKEAYSISSSLVIIPIMYVSMRYLHTQEDNKLLSSVSHLRVSADNETFLFLDAEIWPALPHIPPLETAWFQIAEPFKAIKKIQAWVDGCACRPVRVDIVSYISEDWNVLTWTPMQGPLADADWQSFMWKDPYVDDDGDGSHTADLPNWCSSMVDHSCAYECMCTAGRPRALYIDETSASALGLVCMMAWSSQRIRCI
jgi:hypothetical protein